MKFMTGRETGSPCPKLDEQDEQTNDEMNGRECPDGDGGKLGGQSGVGGGAFPSRRLAAARKGDGRRVAGIGGVDGDATILSERRREGR